MSSEYNYISFQSCEALFEALCISRFGQQYTKNFYSAAVSIQVVIETLSSNIPLTV
jgi:hypothetical protein